MEQASIATLKLNQTIRRVSSEVNDADGRRQVNENGLSRSGFLGFRLRNTFPWFPKVEPNQFGVLDQPSEALWSEYIGALVRAGHWNERSLPMLVAMSTEIFGKQRMCDFVPQSNDRLDPARSRLRHDENRPYERELVMRGHPFENEMIKPLEFFASPHALEIDAPEEVGADFRRRLCFSETRSLVNYPG